MEERSKREKERDYIAKIIIASMIKPRPCPHYTVKLFVASQIVYRIGFLFTATTNI